MSQAPKVFAVEGGELALEIGVGSRGVAARGDPLLREGAELPVLAVGHVPELDRTAGGEVRLGDRLRMKEPLADDARAIRALGLGPMDKDIVGVEAEKQVGK